MVGLKKVRLGDICTVVKGNIGITKAIPGQFPLVATGQNRLSHNEYQFDCKAVCIPLISSAGHGKASLNYVHFQEGKFALGNILCACIPVDENEVDASYLQLYLQSFKDDLIVPLMKGTANVSLTTDKIKGIEINLLDLPIQKSIVARLQSLQSLHREADTTLARLKADVKRLRQSILQDAVQGKLVDHQPEPGEKTGAELLADIRAEKERRVRAAGKKPEKPLPPVTPEEMPFELPEGWVWCRLGEICTKIGSGSTPKDGYVANGIKFFRSQNVYNEGIGLNDISYISPKIHEKMEGTKVWANDILLNITGGSIGRAALVPNSFDEGNVSQHVCIIRPIGIENSFLHQLILSPFFQHLIIHSTTGAGREGLPKYNLEKFPIPLPPLLQQKAIISLLEQRFAEFNNFERRLIQLQKQTHHLWKSELQHTFQFESNG